MKTYRFTLLALTAAAALAGAVTQVVAQDQSGRSRAEVLAEVHAARAAGTLGALHGEDSGSFHLSRQPSQSRPRADVVAELMAYRESGEEAAQVAEELAAMFYARITPPSTLTRAEVHAEVLRAQALGELGVMASEDSGSFEMARRSASDAATHIAAKSPVEVSGLHLSGSSCANPQVLRNAVQMAALTR